MKEVKTDKTKSREWYAVHTYSGYEDAVARYLKTRVDALSLNDKIFSIIVPKEKKIKIRGGKRIEVEEKIYHGYVLVDMVMEPDTWYVVRNTPRVTGFVGADPTNPSPLSKEEINELMSRMGKRDTKHKFDYTVGETVRITDGPFRDHDGKIAEVDEERGRVKVLVAIFGRDTAVELDSLQIRKL
ncbi:MAG: transcription termination/antitermination factor NusG [Candidatus Colwellbacteria bacterium]|nr:transcription termination/antitermination factor NusG [Candidatus Colwellbacteria bacterium]